MQLAQKQVVGPQGLGGVQEWVGQLPVRVQPRYVAGAFVELVVAGQVLQTEQARLQ